MLQPLNCFHQTQPNKTGRLYLMEEERAEILEGYETGWTKT